MSEDYLRQTGGPINTGPGRAYPFILDATTRDTTTMPKAKAKKKGTKRARTPSPEPVPAPDRPTEDDGESDIVTAAAETAETDDPHPVKKSRQYIKLSDAHEELMVEFVKSNDCLYNKKLRTWSDKHLKTKLWGDQARALGHTEEELRQWFHSVRTRLGKLRRWKSGQEDVQMSERDSWIYNSFSFLCPHIVEVQRRNVVSLKAKVGGAAALASNPTTSQEPEDLEMDPELPQFDVPETTDETPTTPVTSTTSTTSVPRSIRANQKTGGSETSNYDDRAERLLTVAERLVGQKEVNTVHDVERTSFSNWVTSILTTLPKPVYRYAKTQIMQLMDECSDRAEALDTHAPPPTPQQLPVIHPQKPRAHPIAIHPSNQLQQGYQPQQPQQPQPQRFQQPPWQQQQHWQPNPSQWPSPISGPPMSVWGSQESGWVSKQCTQASTSQQRDSVLPKGDKATSLTANPNSSTPADTPAARDTSASTAGNLSNLSSVLRRCEDLTFEETGGPSSVESHHDNLLDLEL